MENIIIGILVIALIIVTSIVTELLRNMRELVKIYEREKWWFDYDEANIRRLKRENQKLKEEINSCYGKCVDKE